MSSLFKVLVILFVTGLVASCKVAVIAVEGGQVHSWFSGTCLEGTICIVDVSDPNFVETFIADSDAGWYFQKWNSGDRFLCGESLDVRCKLSFQGYEESKAVEDMVSSSEVFYIMPVFKKYADIIAVDGKQWYQPSFFLNLSWNAISSVCPAGKCDGILNDHDMTGWIWASIDEVSALFNTYGLDRPFTGPFQERYGDNQAYIAISQSFVPTESVCYGDCPVEFDKVTGMLRDPAQLGEQPYTAFVRFLSLGTSPREPELEVYFNNTSYTANPSNVGAWFWRPIAGE